MVMAPTQCYGERVPCSKMAAMCGRSTPLSGNAEETSSVYIYISMVWTLTEGAGFWVCWVNTPTHTHADSCAGGCDSDANVLAVNCSGSCGCSLLSLSLSFSLALYPSLTLTFSRSFSLFLSLSLSLCSFSLPPTTNRHSTGHFIHLEIWNPVSVGVSQ